MDPVHLLIGGRLLGLRGPGDDILDPCDGSLLAQVPRATSAVVGDAAEAARVAFQGWRRSTPADRAAILLDLAAIVEADRADLAAADSANVGMPLAFATATVDAAIDTLRFFAGAARTQTGVTAGEYVPGMTSMVRREPVGVVAAFVPWNVPLLMAVWKIAPAIAAGNTVVIKPSRRTPLSLLLLGERLAGGRIPDGVVNIVTGGHAEVGETLGAHPAVAMLALTGSVAAGAALGSLGARHGKRLHLELGGKTPVIVCADADLEAAARVITRAALDNAGQDCTAPTRILVVDAAHDGLVESIRSVLPRFRIGKPSDPSTDLGPLIADDRRDAVLDYVRTAVDAGARLLYGGKAIPGPGWFMEPALLVDVDARSPITDVEPFGPVISVERCIDEADCVARANASPYGLAAGIWTRSVDRALSIAADLAAGKIWVNEHHRDVTEMPHGGMKASGYGSDLSVYALQDYTTLKAVHIATSAVAAVGAST